MLRSIKAKYSVLFMILDIRQFHVTSKIHVRKVSRKNISDSVKPVNLENDPNPSFMSQNSSIDFLGIESDTGIITLGPPQNKLPSSTEQTKLKEKFHKTSFGVMRYDADNELKFHGQYKNKSNCSFPRQSYEDVQVSISNRASSNLKTVCNNKEINKNFKSYSYENTEENENYIDKYYFNNISEKENLNDKNHPIIEEELNFIDKNYFETSTISENLKSTINFISEDSTNYSNIQTSSENSLDQNNLSMKLSEKERKEIFIEKEHSSEDNVSYSGIQELEFFDENYFKNFTCETQKSSNPYKFSHETLSNTEIDYNFIDKEISELNKTDSFHENLKSDNTEDKIATDSSHMLHDHNEFAADFSSDLKNKENFIESNMEINHHHKKMSNKVEQKLNSVLPDDFESTDSSFAISKTKQISKQKRQLVDNITSGTQAIESVVNKSSVMDSSHKEADKISTAYDFVTKLRKKQEIPHQNIKKDKSSKDVEKFDSKGFRILKTQVDDLAYFTRDEILNLLKQNVVYSDDDLLVLNKPYGLVIHESGTTKYPCLSTFLNDLAKDLDKKTTDPKLFTVHRLDKETTGCLLLARNEMMAQYLKSLFAQRKIIKKYWIITSRVPDPREGVINIPISEGSIDSRKRMVLHAKLPKDINYRNHSQRGKEAITSYKVISEFGNAALVEVFPKTGIKHQIRVHFGFGLSCPILGDHKYSHLDKLAPQKLPSDILQRLKVRQSKARYIPMQIHAKSVAIPQYFEDRDLFVNIPIPDHMKENLKRLKIKKSKMI